MILIIFQSFTPPPVKKQKGFTLVEILLAMAVIAILATAGLSAYTGYIKKARDTMRLGIATQIESAVISYKSSNNGKTPDGAALIAALKEMNIGWNVTPTSHTPLALSLPHTLEALLGFNTVYAQVPSLPIRDPNGGKSVCLDVEGKPNQSCRFDYVKYNDGTYSISYGIESKASMEKNFYQTRLYLDTINSIKQKVGVYLGNASFIGSKPLTSAGTLKADLYKPTQSNGTTILQSDLSTGLTADNSLFVAVLLNEVVGASEGGEVTYICSPNCASTETCTNEGCKCGNYPSCTAPSICVNYSYCSSPVLPCGAGLQFGNIDTVRVIYGTYDKCWLSADLSGYYQWNKNNNTFTNSWNGTGVGSGDPCPFGTHTPYESEWQAFVTASNIARARDVIVALRNAPINLTPNGLKNINNIASGAGTSGYYWSSTPLSGGKGSSLYFASPRTVNPAQSYNAAYAFSVRCIQNGQ